MKLELSTPNDIYQRINGELAHLIGTLNTTSSEDSLNKAQDEARMRLTQYQVELQAQLAELEKNAEWNTFTIAFYGETGAGKSTIIETLRILLKEPTKLDSQQVFRELQAKYGLSEVNLQRLQSAIEQTDARLVELTQKISATHQQHENLHNDALNNISRLQVFIAQRKQEASLLQKLLNLFRKMPEEKELILAEQQLPSSIAAGENASKELLAEEHNEKQNKLSLEQQWQESKNRLTELRSFSDGEIIGHGDRDFTRQTRRYNFELDGQRFALLDVPGIEGNEGLIHEEVEKAVQTAHAVFYVTNQPAPPQTGDDLRKGTLEKIKEHLGAQTEVRTIFNKKITNAKYSLTNRALVSNDESASLVKLDEKMREQLGKHYCGVITLSARPAFLASTDHFAPVWDEDKSNFKDRKKILADFTADDLLEKSNINAFLQLLNDHLLSDSEAKITRANFNKANEALNQVTQTLAGVQKTFDELSEKLDQEGASAKIQLGGSFKALKQRLESGGETLIDNFASKVRKKMYALIENDISNDYFKDALIDKIDAQQEQLSIELPDVMGKEVERFQKDAEDILKRFENHSDELTEIYRKLGTTRLNEKFDFKIKIDNGIKVAGLLGGLIGIALAPFTGGASLWIMGASALSALVSIGKALWSFISTDYKTSQQRKATDDNLHAITRQLRDSLREGLQSALPDMQHKISQLEEALEAPAKQTAVLTQLLSQSTDQLKVLSRQIVHAGNLK